MIHQPKNEAAKELCVSLLCNENELSVLHMCLNPTYRLCVAVDLSKCAEIVAGYYFTMLLEYFTEETESPQCPQRLQIHLKGTNLF